MNNRPKVDENNLNNESEYNNKDSGEILVKSSLDVGNSVGNKKNNKRKRDSAKPLNPFSLLLAGPTRLELATSGVTGRRSNQTELRPRNIIENLLIEVERFVIIFNLHFSIFTFYMVGGTGLEPVTPGL